MNDITIPFPVRISVSDYHEFDSIARLLEKLSGEEVLFKELGPKDKELGYSSHPYIAGFFLYTQKQPDDWNDIKVVVVS